MICPKCRAKIGVVQEAITTNSGITYGGICYMCGHWIQGDPLGKPGLKPDRSFPGPIKQLA